MSDSNVLTIGCAPYLGLNVKDGGATGIPAFYAMDSALFCRSLEPIRTMPNMTNAPPTHWNTSVCSHSKSAERIIEVSGMNPEYAAAVKALQRLMPEYQQM